MTTPLHKTNAHEKARAISSGFWELIKALTPTPRQGLTHEHTSLKSVLISHENNHTTSIIYIACIRARKSISVWFKRFEGFQIVRNARIKAYGPLTDGGLNGER